MSVYAINVSINKYKNAEKLTNTLHHYDFENYRGWFWALLVNCLWCQHPIQEPAQVPAATFPIQFPARKAVQDDPHPLAPIPTLGTWKKILAPTATAILAISGINHQMGDLSLSSVVKSLCLCLSLSLSDFPEN